MKTLLLALLFTFSAQANLPQNDEQVVKQTIDQWYGQIGLSGKVSKGEFEAAVRGYFHYKKQGKIPGKNIIGIVNYKIPSTERRFYIFQIGASAKMLREEWVAHGTNSGPPGGVATSFSNRSESHQSSRGFYKTSETYSGKYGYSLRLDGLENGVNHKVRPRAVVVHGGRYTGPGLGGRSWGCLTLAMNRKDPVINLIKGGVLIYGSDGQSHNNYTFMGGNGSIDAGELASVPGTDNDPGEEVSSNYVAFEDLEEFQGVGNTMGDFAHGGSDFGALGTDEAIPSMSSMDGINGENDEGKDNSFNEDATNPNQKGGTAALHGTSEFEECQNRASAPWEVVIAETKKPGGGDPAKFFKASYRKINDDVKNMDQVPDEVIANMVVNNQHKNERCIALASSMQNSYLDKENKNEEEEYVSTDGEMKCKYEGAESQDYVKCKEMVDTYNASLVAEDKLKEEQSKDFQEKARAKLDEVKNGNGIQIGAGVAQVSLTNDKAAIANTRSQFQVAKLESLNNLQSAMPNRNSILNDCRTYMAGKRPGLKDAQAYINHLEVKNKTIPPNPAPCLAVMKVMKTNLVQNIPARKQAIRVIEKAGLKALDLNGKERSFLNQSSLARRGSIRNSNFGGVNYGAIGKFVGQKDRGSSEIKNRMGYGNVADCQGSNCKYSGGSGMKFKSNRSKKSNFDTNFATYSGGNFAGVKGGGVKAGNVLTFEGKKNSRGVFDEDFYTNVNLALAGNFPVNKLSAAQKKEYDAVMDFNKMSQRAGSSKTKAQNKGVKVGPEGLGREIWFDTSMDLFKIISNRYREAVKDDRL